MKCHKWPCTCAGCVDKRPKLARIDVMEWINLARDKDQRGVVMNTVMILRVL
jgi:hypothetical protein